MNQILEVRRILLFAMVCFCASQMATAQDLARKLDLLNAYPELIVVNGKISTIDASNREVQAMAVKSSRILALGTNDEIRFLAGPKTEVLDAKGRRVLPGLIDGHTHPHIWAAEHWLGAEGDFTSKQYNDPQLKIGYALGNDQAEVLRSLERVARERAQQVGPGKWIWLTAFGGKSLPESRKIASPLFEFAGASGPISTSYLDTLAPNNPMMVLATEAIGPSANNTRAKEEMKRLLGREVKTLQARSSILWDVLLKGRPKEAADLLKRELLQCLAAHGVTTFGNHYYGAPSIMAIYNDMYSRKDMPVRWAWYVGSLFDNGGSRAGFDMGSDTGDLPFMYRNLGDFRSIGNDYIWNAGVSNEAWEVGFMCTQAKPLKPPPSGPMNMLSMITSGVQPDCSKGVDYEASEGFRNVRAALRSGLRVGYLHGYSDGTYDAMFRILDDGVAKGEFTLEQIRAGRISFEHNPMIRPDQVKKMAHYNMMPGFNGYQVQGDIKGGAFLKAYGENYMGWMAPMKSLMDAGAHPVFNTDAHITKVPYYAKDMDYPEQWEGNIWGYIEFFVTRKMPHDGITYNRAEGMDRVNMIRAATIWGAEQAMNEKNIGSLEVGKLADFIIIDKDFFALPEDQIHTIKTLLTSVGGNTVYRDANY